jgi:lactoylglutathione lyase
MVKLGYAILYVSDVTKSITFYEKAFGFERKFITPENDYGELETGQTTMAFASTKLASSNLKESSLNQKPFATELGLVTDQVDETVKQAVQNGATILEEPKQKPWGQTVAYIRDLDGFLLEICSPING